MHIDGRRQLGNRRTQLGERARGQRGKRIMELEDKGEATGGNSNGAINA
jgi:hypothetical protein